MLSQKQLSPGRLKGKRLQTIGIDSDQVISAVNATLKMLNLATAAKKIAER